MSQEWLTGQMIAPTPDPGVPAAGRSDNQTMQTPPATPAALMDDDQIAALQSLLDRVPAPLEPLDVMALDGYLCGVILQPGKVEMARWMAHVADIDGRPLPADFPSAELHAGVLRRHAELVHAIDKRLWFDPWIFPIDDEASPTETVLPWVAGFATALDLFPALSDLDAPDLVEPLALLYLHFDPQDLEDADALLAVIETLEPPPDLAEAVQDIVRAQMLIADISRPLAAAQRPAPRPRTGTRPKRR